MQEMENRKPITRIEEGRGKERSRLYGYEALEEREERRHCRRRN